MTLAHKVESVVFRDPKFPKSQISINAEEGTVFLRGQVDRPELIRNLEAAVHNVSGVRGVENLLHLPGTAGAGEPRRQAQMLRCGHRRRLLVSARDELEATVAEYHHVQAEHRRAGAEGSGRRHLHARLGRLEAHFERLLEESVADEVARDEWRHHLHDGTPAPSEPRPLKGANMGVAHQAAAR